jgi:SWI/SNF-related matrix-associated actin-dependent regulator 1 of chromatin subfamily A
MLEFAASPARVRKATKLAYRYGIKLNEGVDSYWHSLPRVTSIPGFAFKLKPYQAEGVAHLEKWDGNALIGDEPGLGKTAQVMAYAFKNNRFPMLVILPKTLLLNWRREITLMLGSQKSVLVVGFVPSKRRQEQLKAQYPHVCFSKTPLPGFDVTLINYDIVARNQDALEGVKYDYVVVDESHKIKNPKAQRTLSILRLVAGREEEKGKRGVWRVLHQGVRSVTFMTGTPIVNRPLELWTTVGTIASWVPQFANFFNFAQRYCNAHRTQWGWDFSGSSNEAELNQLLNDTIMIRRRKEDVLRDLPPKTFVTVPLEFDRREYDAVASAFEGRGDWRQGMQALVQYGGKPARSDEAIVAINKCREIAGYAKMASAIEWILDYVEEGNKLVVFAHHQRMVDHITASVKSAGVGVRMIRGGVGLEERAQAAQDFQNDPSVRVIVLNIASAGFGITLTAARACAFVQLPWTPGDLIQAADRVHRIGQTDNVTVYNLVAEGTVEEAIGELIMEKAAVANRVVDGGANSELATMNLDK